MILAFYPGDFTPVCTKQFCSYRDDGDRLEDLGVPMVGISPQSVDSHERFAAEHGLTVPLLADPDKKVARAYGVLGPGGFVRRSIFLVDGEGIVRYRQVALFGLRYQDVGDLERAVVRRLSLSWPRAPASRAPFELEVDRCAALAGEEVGEGPPIVLLHGLTATRRYVVHGSLALRAPGYRQISYDARGHGESDPAPRGQRVRLRGADGRPAGGGR